MTFSVLLYASLFVFVLGLIYKVSIWFARTAIAPSGDVSTPSRVMSFLKGLGNTLISKKILILLRTFVLEVLLQSRTFREDRLRWAMHILIYGGFMLLLLMHALGGIIAASLFDEYYSTLNPFFFLRDLFGLFVIIGVAIAVYRRRFKGLPRLKSNRMDAYALAIVGLIIISGFFLEGAKITSHKVFMRMVEDYSDVDGDEELEALEAYWVKEFGLVSPENRGPFEDDVLEQGAEIHEYNCEFCHAPPAYAFGGYTVSKIIRPVASPLDKAGMVDFLYYIHILSCFVGLAYLPFSKMFHIIATPISLLANAVMDRDHSGEDNIATRQIVELDACTHCGTCSQYCSAMMAFEATNNDYILPSEKMNLLKRFVSGKEMDNNELKALQEGVYLCTNCDRCTVVCPSGINLRELWIGVRNRILLKGIPEPLVLSPLSLVRGLNRDRVKEVFYFRPLNNVRRSLSRNFRDLSDPEKPVELPVAGDEAKVPELKDKTFAYCFGCQNCSTVCPVVNSFEDPQKKLGLLPHQIMCCLGLGLTDLAKGPDMLWDCVTCYLCQEHCPQGVKVADILYDLKNRAAKELKVQGFRK